MEDMSVDFIGGNMDGQHRSPVSEPELQTLGYQVARKTHPKGNELAHCLAVPEGLSKEEADQAIKNKFSPSSRSGSGKKSV